MEVFIELSELLGIAPGIPLSLATQTWGFIEAQAPPACFPGADTVGLPE